MFKVIKILGILSVLFVCPAKSNIIVQIINNSAAGVKATYNDMRARKIEKYIESKQSLTLEDLAWRSGNQTIRNVAINTYKGPLNLSIHSQLDDVYVTGRVRTRAQNQFDPLNPTQEVPNINIKAELSGEYPIANAVFNSGRPWDEYKIQVIIDEKQIENSKVSISYKPLEKPRTATLVPLTRPAPARRYRPGEFRQVVRTEYEPSEGTQAPAGPRYEGAFDEQGN